MQAKGQLHEVHKVHYSVSRGGKYLLHVRLRESGRSLPNSPFALTVRPGRAHASRIELQPPSQPLRGTIGIEAAANAPAPGCSLLIQTADRSGNNCVEGGASVIVTCSLPHVQCSVQDNGDGTYLLSWRSQHSTLGVASTRVEVEGLNVRNSPMQLQLLSMRPEARRTEVHALGSWRGTAGGAGAVTGIALRERVKLLEGSRRSNSHPEPYSDLFEGVGLKSAVAGEPSSILLRFRDEHNNLATPPTDRFKVFLGIAAHSKSSDEPGAIKGKSGTSADLRQRVGDLEPLQDVSHLWGPEDSGWLALTYVVKHAGISEVALWCEPEGGDASTREQLPGSPFILHVEANAAMASESYIEQQWTVETGKRAEKAGSGGGASGSKASSKPAGKAAPAKPATGAAEVGFEARTISASDVVVFRVLGFDVYGNAAMPPDVRGGLPDASSTLGAAAAATSPSVDTASLAHSQGIAPEGTSLVEFGQPGAELAKAFRAWILSPDGSEAELPVSPEAKSGRAATYEVRYECVRSGTHSMRVHLNGNAIKGSPVNFSVAPSAAVPHTSKLDPPTDADALVADLEQPAIVVLHTYDKFGNKCDTGGLRVTGRLNLIKQGSHDITILSPSNHTITIEDSEDGTYLIKVAVMLAATVKLIVNMDKDLGGQVGELPPMQLCFVKKSS